MRRSIALFVISIGVFYSNHSFAQTVPAPTTTTYPQTKGYMSFIIPWVTINKNTTTTEFQTATTIGFPSGLLVFGIGPRALREQPAGIHRGKSADRFYIELARR